VKTRFLRAAIVAIGLLGLLELPYVASAQPVAVPETWGGGFWTRERLTGSWGGFRDELGKKGVVFDADMLLTPQGVLSGGRDTRGDLWGNAEYTLNVDTQKLGLWPGGFLKIYAMSSFGDSVNQAAGVIIPLNTATLLPELDHPTTALLNATFTQFLHPKFGLFAGKVYTLDADANEFADDFHTKFLNMGLDINPVGALFPVSAYGGGLVVLPWEGAVLAASVLDPSGTPTNNDITQAFKDGVLVTGEGRFTIKPFGLVGHQLIGFGWSDKQRVSLEQDPTNLARLFLTSKFPRLEDPGPLLERMLARFFPQLLVPTQPINTVHDTWTIYYNFDQFVWSPAADPTRGIGVFFRFGVSDGVANPIKYAYNVGIGGKGAIPGRPRDTFGIGWSRIDFSDKFAPFFGKELGLGLDHSNVVEMYYNVSVTRWLNATLDLQIIDPGLKKTLDSSGELKNVDTAVVAGLRLYMRF